METTRLPSAEHAEFDHLCERLDEFEPLPETFAGAAPAFEQDDRWSLYGAEDSPLDRQIMGGLVTPV